MNTPTMSKDIKTADKRQIPSRVTTSIQPVSTAPSKQQGLYTSLWRRLLNLPGREVAHDR